MAEAQLKAKEAKIKKPFVKILFNGSEDPAATDPIYFAHNNKPYLVPREQEFVIKFDAISHLMVPETRIGSKQNKVTGAYHQIIKKVAFNKPEILEWLTEEEAEPYLAEQMKAQMKDAQRIELEDKKLAAEQE